MYNSQHHNNSLQANFLHSARLITRTLTIFSASTLTGLWEEAMAAGKVTAGTDSSLPEKKYMLSVRFEIQQMQE